MAEPCYGFAEIWYGPPQEEASTKITLSVSDEVARQVRKIAVDGNTAPTAMVLDYLESVAACDAAARVQAVRALDDSFARLSRPMGWPRQELHERG